MTRADEWMSMLFEGGEDWTELLAVAEVCMDGILFRWNLA